MNMIKTGAVALGGLMLFGGSFVGVAAIYGDSMSEVALIGRFFERPPLNDEAEGGDEVASLDPSAGPAEVKDTTDLSSMPDDRRTIHEAALAQRASLPLRSFLLESPFSAAQLAELELQLEAQVNEGERILMDLSDRERRLEIREQQVTDRWREIEEMKALLLERENELAKLDIELKRDQQVAEEREAKSWADLAALFQDGDADDLSPKLLTMDPDDAALVLRQLQPDRVSELLNQLNPEKYQLYVDAYRRAGLDDEEE